MYTLGGEYPESPAESEESVTDESPDNEGSHSQGASPFGGGRGAGRSFPSRRESTAEKQRKWAVRTFTLWCTSEGVTKPLEEMQSCEINQLLKKFYKEARRKDGCDFSKPGLTNIRNALDRYFKSLLNITILKNSEFVEANKAFDEKVSLIEGNAASPWRHSVSISPQDMQQILLSGAIGGSTPLLLLRACWFNILLHFDVGDHLKQRRLSKKQFVIHIDAAGHEHVKMISCNPYDQSKFGIAGATMHSVPGHPLCPVALLKKYLSKLHPDSEALFQCPVQYKVDDSVPVWYEKQAVGVHALEGMMSCLSKEAKLSRHYSNGCLRKSSSLVYLQCGFGFNPRDLNPEATAVPLTATTTNAIPSTSGVSSFSQSSLECGQRLSPSTPPMKNVVQPSSESHQTLPTFFPTNNSIQHSPSFSQSASFSQENKIDNMSSPMQENPPYPQISSAVSLAKGDVCQSSKRPGQASLSHLETGFSGQSRTAIGVCIPTIKMEEGEPGVCEGVQPTFPSESLDFPSVTEAIAVKQEERTSMSHTIDRPSNKIIPLKEGTSVTVNWGGKKLQAEILALDDEGVLNAKDIEWSSKHMSSKQSAMEESELPADDLQPSEQPTKPKKKSRPRKVMNEKSVCHPGEVCDDPFAASLAEQGIRDTEWFSNQATKKSKAGNATSTEPIEPAEDITALKKELDAKNAECAALKCQVQELQRVSIPAVEAHNKTQENFYKMMEDTLSAMEGNVALRLGRIEHRLDSIEQLLHEPRMNLDLIRPEDRDHSTTIDADAMVSVNKGLDRIQPLPATPLMESTTASTGPIDTTPSVQETPDIEIDDEVIHSCMTPQKIIAVKGILQKENVRHKCALKLLPFFFSKEELSSSNTDGTHNKRPLDSTRLNSLKVLVFSRFPIDSPVKKDKVWRFIKGKINSKCRVRKHINKHTGNRDA